MRYFFPGCHRLPPYNMSHHRNLPVTEAPCRTVLRLPTGLQLTLDDAVGMGAIVAHACEHAAQVEAVLATRAAEQ